MVPLVLTHSQMGPYSTFLCQRGRFTECNGVTIPTENSLGQQLCAPGAISIGDSAEALARHNWTFGLLSQNQNLVPTTKNVMEIYKGRLDLFAAGLSLTNLQPPGF